MLQYAHMPLPSAKGKSFTNYAKRGKPYAANALRDLHATCEDKKDQIRRALDFKGVARVVHFVPRTMYGCTAHRCGESVIAVDEAVLTMPQYAIVDTIIDDLLREATKKVSAPSDDEIPVHCNRFYGFAAS